MPKKNRAVRKQIGRRLEIERWDRRLNEKLGRKRRNRARSSHTGNRSFRGVTAPSAPIIDIVVPVVLDLATAHEETCKFVSVIKSGVRSGKRVNLVFSDVEKINTSALMYVLSNIHKLRFEHGERCITGTYPKSLQIERLLGESGFFKLLKVKLRDRVKVPRRSMRFIQFRSSQELKAETIKEVRDELLRDDLEMPRAVAKKIYRAVSEAMTNVGQHAYNNKSFISDRAEDSLRGRWWFSASMNATTNRFSLVFYDAGVGIPKTIPREHPMENIRGVLSLLPGIEVDDAQMIVAAMKLGRTRTHLSNRGKGLLDLTQLIDLVGDGQMLIYSRQGLVTYTAGKTTPIYCKQSVEGTLIEWKLPLNKALVALPMDDDDED
ncbi:STAS domain-containing protein [Hylemonella gracilis]|nr:STAS domain-containing protein [Hylemonella gracilis]